MKVAGFVLIVAGLMSTVFCEEPLQNKSQDPARTAIESAIQDYVSAFNKRDPVKLSQCWSEKAIYVLPDTSEKLVGREAIAKMFNEMFASGESMNLTVAVDEIRFVTSDVAVETGTARLVQSAGDVSMTKYSAIHVKQNDRWLLDSVTDTEMAMGKSASSPLSELEWMIGEWIDASEESSIETVCQWTKNKSFMTRTFKVSAPGTEELEGTQVIGWDPINGSVRSWVFDSDGGFSEGSWTKKGESWVVESTGFTADGETVSSIQVYSKVEADSFHWQTFGRRVGTDRLPDIEEIKVLRKP